MAAIVRACAAFGLTVSKAETEAMCVRPKGTVGVDYSVSVAGQIYNQAHNFVCLGMDITGPPGLSVEISRQVQWDWGCLGRYNRELYDQPTSSLKLKARILKS